MKLNELSPSKGQNKKRKRIGRGSGSGNGTTAGRGHKGHNCRSGGGVRIGFEGGQMPLQRRLPKRGFTNIFKKKYQIINLEKLNKFSFDGIVNRDILIKLGIINNSRESIKLLGKGNIDIALNIVVDKVSRAAKKKIESVGGKVEGVF